MRNRHYLNRRARRMAAHMALAYGASDKRVSRMTGLPETTVRQIGRGLIKQLSASIRQWKKGLR